MLRFNGSLSGMVDYYRRLIDITGGEHWDTDQVRDEQLTMFHASDWSVVSRLGERFFVNDSYSLFFKRSAFKAESGRSPNDSVE